MVSGFSAARPYLHFPAPPSTKPVSKAALPSPSRIFGSSSSSSSLYAKLCYSCALLRCLPSVGRVEKSCLQSLLLCTHTPPCFESLLSVVLLSP